MNPIPMAMTDEPGRARLEAALDPLGVPYELFPCDPALADTAAFCAAYGFDPADSANTIVVVGKSEPRQYAACIVLATHRLDVNRAVRAKFGRGKASFAGPDETREMTGMEIGGVTPFGLPPTLPIWVDGAVMARSGSSSAAAAVPGRSWPPRILLRLPQAEVVDGLASAASGPPPDDVAPTR